MGPEATQRFINPEEVIKRLAAAQGIDVLNLVKSVDERNAEMQQQQQQQAQASLLSQAGQLASSPLMDPSKNPEAVEAAAAATWGYMGSQQPAQGEAPQLAAVPGAQ